MLILGIESSCDETAAAVVKDGREVSCHSFPVIILPLFQKVKQNFIPCICPVNPSYCSLRSQQHASRCTEFMLHCFRQPFRLHKEEFVSYSGFSILSMRYPIPMCVWIYCTPFFSGSSFFRSVAIKTLREATSFSEQRPQIC